MNRKPGRFESVLSVFTDAVIILNAAGMVEWLNDAAEQMLGVSGNIVAGKPVSSLLHEDTPIHAAVAQALDEGVSLTDHDTRVKTRRGEDIPVGIAVYPLYDEENGGAVVILRDLGVLKSLERYMAISDRMAEMAGLAAGIAHEIKNPLGGIRGAAQLLEKFMTEESLKEYTELIISEVDRINRMVVELIDLNKPGVLLREPVNVYPVLDDVLRLLAAPIGEKKLEIVREFDPSLPNILGDADRLRQIFLNLIKNAVEASFAGGRITVKTSLAWRAPVSASKKERRFVTIEVMDEGPGLDEEAQQRIFTPFFSTKAGGSGLGAAMTLHLVQAHGGMLEIGNRPAAKGVAACVYLPYRE